MVRKNPEQKGKTITRWRDNDKITGTSKAMEKEVVEGKNIQKEIEELNHRV